MSPTWRDVEAAKAEAAAENLERDARSYGLPPGYIAGFFLTLSNEIVTIGLGIADVNGIFVRRKDDHILEGEDWVFRQLASSTYYIYIDREAGYHIEPIAPEFNILYFGDYHPVNLYRFVGKFTTNASNVVDDVINEGFLKIEDIDALFITSDMIATDAIITRTIAADAVTAAEILADTITAIEIAVATLQAQFMRITGSVTIGYEGTGTIASPDEGDRRIYIDGDEISFVEYTDGAWSTVNQIRLGGVDSNSLFYPFLQCRGVLNPLADEVSVEFFPSAEFRVFNFENNYEDQHGVDDWFSKLNVATSTAQKKFGLRSLFATAGQEATLTSLEEWTPGESQAAGILVYFSLLDIGDAIQIVMYGLVPDNYIYLEKSPTEKMRVVAKIGGVVTTVNSTIPVTTGVWIYVAFVYDAINDTLTLIHNDEVITEATSGTWVPDVITVQVKAHNNWNGQTNYLDEVLFAPDQLIDPDLFVQHYNHNVAWNTDVSAKDILLKPAPGGRVVIEGGLAPSFDSGWLLNEMGGPGVADWTNVHLGNDPTDPTDNLTHGLNAPLSDLLVKVLISTDGTDANSFEISNFNRGGSLGLTIHAVDNNNIKIQSASSGLTYNNDAGTTVTIAAQDWSYKIKVWKLG